MTLSLADECERLNEPSRLLDEEKKIISPAVNCLFRLGKTTYDLVLTLADWPHSEEIVILIS